jgi:hypothetical protein
MNQFKLLSLAGVGALAFALASTDVVRPLDGAAASAPAGAAAFVGQEGPRPPPGTNGPGPKPPPR